MILIKTFPQGKSYVFSSTQLYFWFNTSFVVKNPKFGCVWPENPAEDTLVDAKLCWQQQ